MKEPRENIIVRISMVLIIIMMIACNDRPKVIEATKNNSDPTGSTHIFTNDDTQLVIPEDENSMSPTGVHTVMVLEKLPTERYVYLRVKEGNDEYWVATGKAEFNVGGVYFYSDGLLKTNFESKEYTRVFDRLYLVSTLVDSNHGDQAMEHSHTMADGQEQDEAKLVKISELISNKSQYAGKLVKVKGICVKVNANIMGRNWIHVVDGSKDTFDFVITSNTMVTVGQKVTMVGRLAIDKDFGSGYQYDVLLEEAELM